MVSIVAHCQCVSDVSTPPPAGGVTKNIIRRAIMLCGTLPGVFISAMIDPCAGSNLQSDELALSVRTLMSGLP